MVYNAPPGRTVVRCAATRSPLPSYFGRFGQKKDSGYRETSCSAGG